MTETELYSSRPQAIARVVTNSSKGYTIDGCACSVGVLPTSFHLHLYVILRVLKIRSMKKNNQDPHHQPNLESMEGSMNLGRRCTRPRNANMLKV